MSQNTFKNQLKEGTLREDYIFLDGRKAGCKKDSW